MRTGIFWASCLMVVVAVFLGGCYNYTPPPVSMEEDTFTQRKKDANDSMLKAIDVISLDQAQQIAVKNNPNYISMYHAVSAARMRYYQALGAYFPQLQASFQAGSTINSYSGQVNSIQTDTNNFGTGSSLNATWLLFDGLARTMNALAAKHQYKYQQALEEDTRRLLLRGIAYAYNDILLAVEKQRIARADMDFQLKNLKETQLKYQAGAVPLSDVLNFKIKVNESTGNQITAEYQYDVAVYALSVLMGYPEGTLPPHIKFPAISTETDEHLTSIEVYLDTALNNRPDLRGYREQLLAAQYGLYKTYGSYSPTVSAYGSFGYNTSLTRYNSSPANINHSYYNNPETSYGIQADWTLFNGFIRYNTVRESQALVAQAKFGVANIWLTVVQDVRSAYINYVQNVKQAKLYEITLGLVTKQRDLVEEEYKAGNTELTRLNEAQRNLVEAETNLVSALVNVKKAKAQMEAATNTNTTGFDITSNSN
ncbi:MAG: TolC family protein [Victivallaceae bacterium]